MKQYRVLVLNGGSVSAHDIARRLDCLGYAVIPLADCSLALATAAGQRPDLILFDPTVHGDDYRLAIAERINSDLKIPAVLIAGLPSSNSPHPTEKSQKSKSAYHTYLLAPLDDIELGSAIKRALDKHDGAINESFAARDIPVMGETLSSSKRQGKNGKNQDAAFAFIKQVSPFSELPDRALDDLVERAHFTCAKPGDYLSFEGDHNNESFIVLSGRLAMTKTSVSGKDLIVQLLGPQDLFGLILAMENLPEQLSTRAQSDAEVLWIPTSALLRVLASHPDLYRSFLGQLSARMHSSHNLSCRLAHDTVQGRIAALLLFLSAKFARPAKDGNTAVLLDITRQQIADLTGTTPETASRVTRAMHRQGILDMSTPGVIRVLDLELLEKLREEDQPLEPISRKASI